MTLIECFIFLCLLAPAVIGLVAGFQSGILCSVFGLLVGPLLGFTVLAVVVGAPLFVLAQTGVWAKVNVEKPSGRVVGVVVLMIYLGTFVSALVGCLITIIVVERISLWLIS